MSALGLQEDITENRDQRNLEKLQKVLDISPSNFNHVKFAVSRIKNYFLIKSIAIMGFSV